MEGRPLVFPGGLGLEIGGVRQRNSREAKWRSRCVEIELGTLQRGS